MTDQEQPETTAESKANPGDQLRRERERRGLSLAQVAGELHMDAAVAASLEAGEFDTLGAPIFVRGHLRNYARLLGLDADAVVAEYERLADPTTPDLVRRKPAGDVMTGTGSSYRWVSIVGWLVLLALVVLLGLWAYHGGFGKLLSVANHTESGQQVSQALPAQTPSATPAEQAGDSEQASGTDTRNNGSVAVPTQDQAVVDGAPGQQATGEAPGQNAVADKTGAPQSAGASADTAGQQPAKPAPPPDNRLTLELSLNQKSWVEVYDADNEPLLYDLLPAGSSKTFKASPPVRLFFGNASGVSLSVNGKNYDVAAHERDDHTARFTIKQP